MEHVLDAIHHTATFVPFLATSFIIEWTEVILYWIGFPRVFRGRRTEPWCVDFRLTMDRFLSHGRRLKHVDHPVDRPVGLEDLPAAQVARFLQLSHPRERGSRARPF